MGLEESGQRTGGSTQPLDSAGDPLRRGVRTANRRDDANALERAGDAKTGEPRVVGREQDVAIADINALMASPNESSFTGTTRLRSGIFPEGVGTIYSYVRERT